MEYQVFDSLLDGVAILDEKLHVIYLNSSFFQMCDLPQRRLGKMKTLDEVLKTHPPLVTIQQLVDVVEATPYKEIQFQLESGRALRFQVSVQKEPDQQNWILFFRDVTLEDRLQQKYQSEMQQKEGVIKRLDRKLFETSLLYEVSQGINFSSEIKDVLALISEKLEEAFGFSSSQALLLERDLLNVDIQIRRSSESEVERKYQFSVGDHAGFLKEIVDKNRPIFLKLGQNPQDDSHLKALFPGMIENVLLLPACSQDMTGLLALIDTKRGWSNHEEDRNLLVSVRNQLILSIDNYTLYQKSIRDGLTGMYNARYFHSRLANEVKRADRSQLKLSLIIIDVDFFKKFNDSYGHQIGDRVLQQVAQIMKKTARETDVPARYGGEEFAVILTDTDGNGAWLAGERFRKAIEASSLATDHGDLKITVSVGACCYPDYAKSPEALIELADKCLYRAKHNGRNNTQLYRGEETAPIRHAK